MKRWFWLATGFGLGVAAARRARRGNGPQGSGENRPGVARWLRAHVQGAVDAGREETRRRERALRNVLAAPSNGAREDDK